MSNIPERSRALVVGESLVDIVRQHDRVVEHPGGSPMNVSFGLGRLGMDVTFLTRLGDDDRGRSLVEHLASAGVVVVPGAVPGVQTSTAQATLSENGSAEYHFEIDWSVDSDIGEVEADVLHFGSIAAFLSPGATGVRQLVESRCHQLTVTFDPNIRPALLGERESAVVDVERSVALCDVVKASDEDLEWLYPGESADAVADRWIALGAGLVFVTRGCNGSLARTSAVRVETPSRLVEVVDTIGAGDAYMAGIISALAAEGLLGGGHKARLRLADASVIARVAERATECAALTVARAGANPPRLHEVGLAASGETV